MPNNQNWEPILFFFKMPNPNQFIQIDQNWTNPCSKIQPNLQIDQRMPNNQNWEPISFLKKIPNPNQFIQIDQNWTNPCSKIQPNFQIDQRMPNDQNWKTNSIPNDQNWTTPNDPSEPIGSKPPKWFNWSKAAKFEKYQNDRSNVNENW